MPRARYPVLDTLQDLSKEADCFVDQFPLDSAVVAWFAAVKETFIRISNCTSVKDIEYPPDISTVFAQDKSNRSGPEIEIPEAQRVHIHDDKHLTAGGKDKPVDEKENAKVVNKSLKSSKTPKHKKTIEPLHDNNQDNAKKSEARVVSSNKTLTPSITHGLPYTPKTNSLKPFNKSIPVNISTEIMHTPIMDKTFNKLTNSTIILDSNKSNSNSKSTLTLNKAGGREIIVTRSGSKRKSSVSKEESNKKRKIKTSKDIPTTSATKSLHSKCNVEKQFVMKSATAQAQENKKLSAVIVPMPLKQTPVLSKGRQILQEIKKKEEKANENRKKVMAERQLKTEESKKKRAEKREKMLEKRMQMEKEKEGKRDIEDKRSQATKETIKKSGMKSSRVKDLIDQNAKENKVAVTSLSSSKQSKPNAGDVVKTPASQKSKDSENYDLTPIPDSSTYDFSEAEDDRPTGKPIPLWAQGVHLKSALLHQFYNPPATDEIFGNFVEAPDLAVIFNIQKKRYKVRTSSAVWSTPPERSFRC